MIGSRILHILHPPSGGPFSDVRVLRDNGFEVVATDLVDYASPDQDQSGVDFLLEQRRLANVIVTNPPFKLAADFVRHAWELRVERVIMLLRPPLLESDGVNLPKNRATSHWLFPAGS